MEEFQTGFGLLKQGDCLEDGSAFDLLDA